MYHLRMMMKFGNKKDSDLEVNCTSCRTLTFFLSCIQFDGFSFRILGEKRTTQNVFRSLSESGCSYSTIG